LETISKPRRDASDRKGLRAAIGIRSPNGWCEIDGCQIAWQEVGGHERRTQPILCLHAAGSGSREFHPLLNHRMIGSRLIFVDWPGHGRSDGFPEGSGQKLTVEYGATMLQRLIGQLEIEQPILLGSGFGAAAAIRFAADFPHQALGLVLCQPSGLVASNSSGSSRQGNRGLRTMLRRIEKYAPGKAGSQLTLAAKRQALRIEILKPIMRSAVAVARKSLERSSATLRSALESLTIPALFALLHDSLEYPLSRYIALLEPSMAWAPRHQFTVFEGAFNPIWDEPKRFSQMLTGFVQARLPLENHTHAWMISAVDWPTKDNNLWKCVHPECGAERVLPAGKNAN